ncbi:MAG: DNRLRE domain-containing protein [Bacteroidales bacterium]|nr:DNRLRE domain-containing protein [Bacteroidales bacterium]MCF8457580.1 DNRLRE domain-containing protein [Bacteroidales bacterium]
MKTKIFLLVLALGLFVSGFCQNSTIELEFTAKYNGHHVPLDSILIENLTSGKCTTLYAPDTVCSLNILSISDYGGSLENSLCISQNYPNPFDEKTRVNLYLPKKEKVEIVVRDILGRGLVQYENVLNPGNHSFEFYSGNEKYYLFTVIGENTCKTIKMLNANNNTSLGKKCKIIYLTQADHISGLKSIGAYTDFVFEFGNQLRYIGYAKTINAVNGSSVIEDVPQTNELYEFEITEGIPCPGIPIVNYDTQDYNTVLIGSQCWLKENLNVGTMINGNQDQLDNNLIEKYCYDNNPINCDTYGGLYQWDEMMEYASSQSLQGICPPDWHLPSDDDWKQLEGEVDNQYGGGDSEWDGDSYRGFDAGLILRSTDGWYSNGNGTDLYGFSAIPGGFSSGIGDYYSLSHLAEFWSSTEHSNSKAWYRKLYDASDQIYRFHSGKSVGFSVRCVQDIAINSLPLSPSGLTSSAISSTQINLSWDDNSSNENGFKIERSPNGNTNWTVIQTTANNVTNYENTGLSASTTYYYRVKAFNTAGSSSYSNTSSSVTLSASPDAPSGLTANAISNSQINLSWTDNSFNENGFKIERSPNGSTNWTVIQTTANNVTNYENTGLSASTTYYYRVKAFNATGNSIWSNIVNEATQAPPLSAPVLTGPFQATEPFELTWTYSWPVIVSTNDHYELEYSNSLNSGYQLLTVYPNGNISTPFTETIIPESGDIGLTCYFRIRAKVNGIYSPYSNVIGTYIPYLELTVNSTYDNTTAYSTLDPSLANTVFNGMDMGVGTEYNIGLYFNNFLVFSSALYFDINSFISGNTIQSATLKLNIELTATDFNTNYIINPIVGYWNTNTLTWNNQPNYYTSPSAVQSPPTYSGIPWEVDITSIVQAWANGTIPNYGIYIRDNSFAWPSSYTNRITYFLSNQAPTTYIPELHIVIQ